jgi:hypothetical protein
MKKRQVPIAAVVVGSVLLICGLGGWLVWSKSDMGAAAAELDQAVIDAKAAGLPWVAADLDQRPAVKEGENAAPLIRQAQALIDGDAKLVKALKASDEAQRGGDDMAMRAALDTLQPLVRLARLAADKPRCDFHRDWDEGAWLMFPELADVKLLAKVLGAQAVAEAGRGDVSSALQDLGRTVTTGRHAGAEPVLIGMLVDLACESIAVRAAEQIAEKWHADAARLALLREKLGRLGPEPDFVYALKGESYMGVAVLRNVRSRREFMTLVGDSSVGSQEEVVRRPTKFVRSGVPPTLFGRIFLCRNLQMWLRFHKEISGISNPIVISRILDKISKREQQMGWSHLANHVLVPMFSQAGDAVAKGTAYRLCTAALAAVLEFKSKRGRYPINLAEVGVTDKDPFDGKPLKLRVDGEECRVYSVGPDGEDNGGVRQSELAGNTLADEGWDVVASYPAYRPAAKQVRTPISSSR